MPALWSALLSTAIGGLIVFASYGDPVLVAAAVLFIQYLLASGPGATDERGRRIPTPRFTPVIAGSIAAVAVSARPDSLSGSTGAGEGVVVMVDTGVLTGVPVGLAVGFFVAIVAQMFRRDGRRDLVRSLGHVVLILVVAVLAIGWIGAARTTPVAGVNAVVAGSMAIALVTAQIPRPREDSGTAGQILAGALALLPLLFAAGVAVAVGQYYEVPLSVPVAAMVGALVAVFSIVGRDVAAALSAPLRHAGPRWGFTGAFPVALVGPLAFIAGQLHGL